MKWTREQIESAVAAGADNFAKLYRKLTDNPDAKPSGSFSKAVRETVPDIDEKFAHAGSPAPAPADAPAPAVDTPKAETPAPSKSKAPAIPKWKQNAYKKWGKPHTCSKCGGIRFKTVHKGKEWACRNCGTIKKA